MNLEFSFTYTSCLTKAEEPSLSCYLPIAGGRIIGFIPFPRVLVLCEMQLVSSRIWTHITLIVSELYFHWVPSSSGLSLVNKNLPKTSINKKKDNKNVTYIFIRILLSIYTELTIFMIIFFLFCHRFRYETSESKIIQCKLRKIHTQRSSTNTITDLIKKIKFWWNKIPTRSFTDRSVV